MNLGSIKVDRSEWKNEFRRKNKFGFTLPVRIMQLCNKSMVQGNISRRPLTINLGVLMEPVWASMAKDFFFFFEKQLRMFFGSV